MATNLTVIDRDYIDNFSIKEFAKDELVAKYFESIDPSLRTVGTLGYTTEMLSNISEDAFNTGSVLFRETFPNRAEIPESIYSHAAIFQLSNVFSTAANCKFLLVLEEGAIIKNMINDYDKDTGIYHFYIDKNTKIYVEDKIFTLDYDIKMNIVKKINEYGEDYLFTATYILDAYHNSISDVTDPYVKVRRSSDGYIALEVQTHQCFRDVRYDTLVSNSVINYPIIDIEFTGKLAGFDVLYKPPTATGWQQLDTKIVYAQASQNPFCYYQMVDNNKLRITFNTKDNFFMPEFNSEIQVILYITEGEEGNFDVYLGSDITLIPDNEVYTYANKYLVAAKPIGSSKYGIDQMDIESLQEITVENYRTATAITTEPDLMEYFRNYKYRYGDASVMFIKKRDDVYERVWSGFFIIRKGTYIYNTNTLKLKMNLSDMKNPERNVYTLEPGFLFTANEDNGYAEFFRDTEKYEQYYNDYLLAVENGEIPYIKEVVDPKEIPAYLNRPASFAEYKLRNGLDDKLSIFDLDEDEVLKYDEPGENKFLLINPFLVRFKKEPNLVSTYMTYVSNHSLMDFTNQNDDCYVQFVTYILNVTRKFTKDKKYMINATISPSIKVDDEYPIIQAKKRGPAGNVEEYVLNDRTAVTENDVRVILMIKDTTKNVCFTELYPTEYDSESESFTFSAEIFTDDHITSDGRMRILTGAIYREVDSTDYYKVHEDDATLYDKYNENDEIIATDIPVDDITEMKKEGKIKLWQNVINMSASHDILIPMTDVECKVYTLYRRVYDPEDGKLILTTEDQTNNIFSEYDETLKGYIWTNEYSTSTTPITFIKPLDSIRTYLSFEDYTEAKSVENEETGEVEVVFTHDIMDVQMYSLSMLRAKTVFDTELLEYFLDSFYAQYTAMVNIIQTRLRNATNIDVKLYNTYGRSKNFLIGEEKEVLDTVNLALSFDVWFVTGTDTLSAVPEIKAFIKKEVETINENGMNNLFISNLMRKIENTYAYVDHIRFNSINHYSTDYQAVRNIVTDLNDLSVEDRRFYVPELLVCNVEDITITEYFAW